VKTGAEPKMSRYIVAFALLVVYVTGSVLAVKWQGEAYRDALRRDRLAAVASLKSREKAKETTIVAKATTVPASDPANEPDTKQSTPVPATTNTPIEPQTPAILKKDGAATSLNLPAPLPGPAMREKQPLEKDPFWESPMMTKVWDIANLTPQDETRLGKQLNDLVLKFERRSNDPKLIERAEDAAEPYVNARTRKEIEYTFTVLDSDAVNAFSHPGGYVYVTKGMLDWLGEDQSHALEFVIAHEVAHVDLQHALTCLRDPELKRLELGTLGQFLTLVFPRGYYPESLDSQADTWAYTQMTRLGRSKLKTFAFLRKLTGFAAENGFVEDRAKLPKPGPNSSPLDTHLRAHPAPRKRLKGLEAVTNLAPQPPK